MDKFDLRDTEPSEAYEDDFSTSFGGKPARIPLFFAFAAALTGLILAGTSTSDFVQHLDRQVHAVHCSVMPGGDALVGESGCRTVMLSMHSSWFRDQYWGGIPISLFAMAVFAFLAYRSGHLLLRGKPKRSEAAFLTTAGVLPVVMSIIYGNIAYSEIGEMCSVCMGIYIVSGVFFVAALVSAFMTERPPPISGEGAIGRFAIGIVEGIAFVAVTTLIYMGSIPEVSADNKSIKGAAGCGTLAQPEDPANIMIDLSTGSGGAPSIELLDPLCPACRAFDERLEETGLGAKLNQKAVLFPLDSKCNWMLETPLHPGACAVAEAMLCAPGEAKKILKWSFDRQEELTELGKTDERKLRRLLSSTFPTAKRCMGTAVAKNRMVKSLRWAVANALPVMTPQLFINGKRLCDEDTDLGLEYTLGQMVGAAK
jgi:uncharacterized membrane protein